MVSATESRRNLAWATAATLAVLAAVLATLWQYPSAELVVFHAVWIGLAVIALRTPPPRFQSWVLVGFVTVLAAVIEIDDVRSGDEGKEVLIELVLDLLAFVALVVLARRHRRALAAEHDAAIAELRRNERQRAFFANASHGLRTPITVARGHAELALEEAASPAVEVDMRVVLEELDRLTRATDRILRLSVAGEIDPQRLEPVDVDELITSTVERWRPTAPRTWLADARSDGCRLMADPEALTEALDAMIENALAATYPGGAISARSEINGDTVVLSVIDDGHGVDGVEPEQLFDAFQQGPYRPRHAPSGTGLGLSIVRAIALAHGGDAAMHTTPYNGTTVSIVLPCNPGILQFDAINVQEPIVAS